MENTNQEQMRGSARRRIEQRKKRREAMAVIREDASSNMSRISKPKLPAVSVSVSVPTVSVSADKLQTATSAARDILWHLLNRTIAVRLGALMLVLVVGIFVTSSLLASEIPPNVWAMNQPIGRMSKAEAGDLLFRNWHESIRIRVLLEGDVMAEMTPDDIGLVLDIDAMVEAASSVGLSGIPLGVGIEPMVSLDYGEAENYLLSIVNEVYLPPYEAGYAFENGELVGVSGRSSRELDIVGTLEAMQANPLGIFNRGQVELLTNATPPDVIDPTPFLSDAREFVDGSFTLLGYDPYTNDYEPWTTTEDQLVNWLAAGYNSLTLREEPFERFIDAVNDTLRNNEQSRYLNDQEAYEQVNRALMSGDSEAILRLRYTSSDYTVEWGDNGYRIGQKTGLPFNLIDELNPDIEWGALSVGDTVRIPSRDKVLPLEPIANKRIVVDLTRQWLVAFENEEIVFSWPISSGRSDAPTYTGIFQILSHAEVAYGSSFSLCNASGTSCGQWEMNWFMGVYEVVPGLMNGFHGAVLLPDGTYLGGGGVRYPSTFGCVMSEDEQARQLYDWAELGTIVEITGSRFEPQSDLAVAALEHMDQYAY